MQQWLQEAWSPENPVTMVVRTTSWAKGPFIFNTLTRVAAFIESLVIVESICYIIMLNSLEKTLYYASDNCPLPFVNTGGH